MTMPTNYTDFEDYLKSMHAEGYTGTDDDMSDHFNDWLYDSDIGWLIDQADRYANIYTRQAFQSLINQ